jgi:hypothetical protein
VATRLGDVQVLQTEKGKRYAIGRVPKKGPEGCHRPNPRPSTSSSDHDEALGVARTLVRLGGGSYLVKIDRDEWAKDGE